jgi:branched-chain amino acid transport system substrate-binding protein
VGPVYTPLAQIDFAAEIARIRAEKPDAVFVFLIGAGGVAFVKQYAQAGMSKQIPLYVEDPAANPLNFAAEGDAALGAVVSTNWYPGIDNPTNRKFVSTFIAKYGREPAVFAALGYPQKCTSTFPARVVQIERTTTSPEFSPNSLEPFRPSR